MKNLLTSIIGFLLYVSLSTVAVAIIAFVALGLNAWAISILWHWFAVQLYALPTLGFAKALGFLCLAHLFCHQAPTGTSNDVQAGLSYVILRPFMYVIVGYIVRFWVIG